MSEQETRRILVGYVATAAGRDALRLGTALAKGRDAELHVVIVAPRSHPYTALTAQGAGYERVLQQQLRGWVDEAVAGLPQDITAHSHVVPALSDAEGLLSAAHDLDAHEVVIGARGGGVLGRYRMGSVAQALLHSSHIPVVLAPRGFEGSGPISRITALFGDRPGGVDVLNDAFASASTRDTRLRLVTFTEEPQHPSADTPTKSGLPDATTMRDYVLEQLERFATPDQLERAQALIESGQATTRVVSGEDIEKSMRRLDWEPNEIVVVGSSRLAPAGRAFLGSTAARVLRSVSVPMVVTPASE